MTPCNPHQCPHFDEDFKQQVIEGLASLKTDMKSIIGNGQPGRLQKVEDAVSSHGTTLNRIIGGLLLLSSGVAISIIAAIVKAWK